MKTLKPLIVALVLMFSWSAFAATKKTITDTKTWNKSFSVNSDAQFNLSSRESDITISTWDKNQVEVTVTLTVEAFEQEEIDKLFEAFTPIIDGNSMEVSVSNPSCVQQVISTPNRMRLKINNQIVKVKKYHFSYDIKMPSSNHINLKNRFGDVTFGSHQGRVDMELYESDFSGLDINSIETLASLKFSNGSLGSSKKMELTTYESDVNLKRVGLLNLNAKFSDITFLAVNTAEVNAYESKLDLGVTSSVTAKQNFGKLKIAEAKQLTLTSYELTFETGTIDDLTMPSTKFSKISCGSAGTVKIGIAYENRMTFGEIQSLEMEAKFSNVDIAHVEEFVEVTGYELRLNVGSISSNFSKINLNAQFSDASFAFKGSPGYSLKSNISFGNLEFPNENLEDLKVDKKGNQITVSGKTKGYNGNSTITIKGYETKVALNYN